MGLNGHWLLGCIYLTMDEDSRQSEMEWKMAEFIVIAVIYLVHTPCVTWLSLAIYTFDWQLFGAEY